MCATIGAPAAAATRRRGGNRSGRIAVMSTSSPPAGSSMRQQLDELDALLQRMLELPINQLDDPPAAEPPAVAVPEPPAMLRPPPRRREPPPVALWPLVAVNRLFDGVTGVFGWPGLWLRTPGGRSLLGFLGLLLLAAGVARGVLDALGW